MYFFWVKQICLRSEFQEIQNNILESGLGLYLMRQ